MQDVERRLFEIDQEFADAARSTHDQPYADPLTGREAELGQQLFQYVFGEPLPAEPTLTE